MNKYKNLIFSIASLILFAIIGLAYCSPILSDDAIIQPDIVNYRGSAQEMLQFQEETGEKTYWSNAMFGGMPTYQTGATYSNDLIKKIDKVFRFLPRPADYIFLLFAGFFFLGMVLFKNWKYALVGSVFFAMGAYYYIIIGAGHNAKVHSIAYFAPLAAGIILLYRQKFIAGFLVTALFMGLELSANHPQMTYYFFLVMLVFFFVELGQAFKFKKVKPFFISTLLLAGAVCIGLGLNSARLMTTYEYSKETTRGKSELTLFNSNQKGLDHDYITGWSYGKLETFNLFIPNFMGGPSQPRTENLKNYIDEFRKQQYVIDLNDEFNAQFFDYLAEAPVSTYWGEQPGTSGPAYQGAVVVFLFFLGLFLVRNKWKKYKWWLLGATVLSIVLAWGRNLEWLTHFMIDYFPFYDKFRAVSSMLVMAEFTMPLLAILAVYVFFKDDGLSEEFKLKVLKFAGGGVVALLIIFYLFGGSLFDFSTEMENFSRKDYLKIVQEYNSGAVGVWDSVLSNLQKALEKDRLALFRADTLRTLIFVLLTLALLIGYQLKLIRQKLLVIIGIGILALTDGWMVDKRYLNDDNFVDKIFVQHPFPTQMSPKLEVGASQNHRLAEIAQKVPYNRTLDSLRQQDPTTYRVFDNIFSTFNEATTSYFAHSVGGYHGAKLRLFQDVTDLYFSGGKTAKKFDVGADEMEKILSLLNTKYIVMGSARSPMVELNDNTYGNAWLTHKIHWAENPDDEILSLKDVSLRSTVILNKAMMPEVNEQMAADGLSSIRLKSYAPNRLVYEAEMKSPKIAVFSEIYYPYGWKAFVDGQERKILKADYFLRALPLEAGDKEIVMVFEPRSVKTGETLNLIFGLLFILLVLGGGYYLWKGNTKKDALSIKVDEPEK